MRPIRISHLSLGFFFIVVLLVLSLSGLMWIELNAAAKHVRVQEQESAKNEVQEGLKSAQAKLNKMAQDLANWDETRQQLMFSDYYSLWRDLRVRDAGMISNSVDAVALYNKEGRILAEPRGETMPTTLPIKTKNVLFSSQEGHSHLFIFFPVYADPGEQILLGYGGIKVDFISEMLLGYAYRFADITSLKVDFKPDAQPTLEQAVQHVTYNILPNQNLDTIKTLLQTSFIRLLAMLLVLLLLGAYLFRRLLVQPLNRITREIDRLKNTSSILDLQNTLEQPMQVNELESMRKSFREYHNKLAELRQDLERNNQDFFDQARHDALTTAFNRRAFEEDWERLADSGFSSRCMLLLFDCDHFKPINDTYGHTVGDAVIQAIATILMNAVRSGDRLYRLGGDEFATLLPNSDVITAERVAERCLQQIQCHDFLQYGVKEPVSISIGVASSKQGVSNLHVLHTQADLAMYHAKRPGNRKIVFFSEDMDSMSSLVSSPLVSAVYEAIQNPSLIKLHYQPIVSLPSGEPSYAEALTRIEHEGELIMPRSLFPIIHAHRLDVEFDIAVIRSLSNDIEQGRAPLHGLSINISPPGIVDDQIIQHLMELKANERNRKIVVEITETALITQIDKASQNIQTLRAAGYLVALDDFGSGYSSLRYLSVMPVDLVKFDISMIRLLLSDESKQRLMVGEFANIVSANGYQIVAEGVETEEMLDRVNALGFNYAQGFLFGK